MAMKWYSHWFFLFIDRKIDALMKHPFQHCKGEYGVMVMVMGTLFLAPSLAESHPSSVGEKNNNSRNARNICTA